MHSSAAVQHIRHLSSLGLAARVAVPAMVDALAYLVPARTRNFIWLDDNAMPCDMYEREPIASALNAFFEHMPALARSQEPSIDKLVRLPVEYGAGRLLMQTPHWEMSVIHNELFRPYGIGNNLDFPIRDGARALGLLTINREPGSREFTPRETDALLQLRKYFLHAMQAPGVLDAAATPSENVAVLVLARDGTVLDCESSASHVLSRLGSGHASGFRMLAANDPAPAALMVLCGRLAALRRGQVAPTPVSDIATRWGTVRARAHLMDAQGNCTLTVQRLIPKTVHRMERLAQIHLSPREKRVALAMCAGGAGDDIALVCGITSNSYRQYAKRIYARLDVASRDGVRQLLDSALPASAP